MRIALTRPVSPRIGQCQLTYMKRQPISYERALKQHSEYKCALQKLGLRVISLPSEPELPDSVFVEDTALVLNELAVIGATAVASRHPELLAIKDFLSQYREIESLGEGAKFEGGDVVRRGKTIYVGESRRTCQNAFERLHKVLEPLGYNLRRVRVLHCLHLSTGATYVGNDTILANPKWIDVSAFTDCRVISVCEEEPWAANTLTVDGVVLMPEGFPKTRFVLEQNGFCVHTVDISEFLKAEGSVSCLTNLIDADIVLSE